MNRTWTKEEVEYLKEKWGNVSIPILAKKLNRSVNAVKLKAGEIKSWTYVRKWSICNIKSIGDSFNWKKFFLILQEIMDRKQRYAGS